MVDSLIAFRRGKQKPINGANDSVVVAVSIILEFERRRGSEEEKEKQFDCRWVDNKKEKRRERERGDPARYNDRG
jgi:hypothetical protein